MRRLWQVKHWATEKWLAQRAVFCCSDTARDLRGQLSMSLHTSLGQKSAVWTGLSEVSSFDFNLRHSCSLLQILPVHSSELLARVHLQLKPPKQTPLPPACLLVFLQTLSDIRAKWCLTFRPWKLLMEFILQSTWPEGAEWTLTLSYWSPPICLLAEVTKIPSAACKGVNNVNTVN